MSSDPNGTRWSNSESNVGKNMLKKSGWQEGTGLGKEQDGVTSHIKVSRKDDMMGIGYKAGVAETWSTQSVGFADVLERIKSKRVVAVEEDSDEDGAVGSPVSPSASSPTTTDSKPSSPTESRHYRMYAKRNALKTELLRADNRDKKDEILGHAAAARKRETATDGMDGDGSASDSDAEGNGQRRRKQRRKEEEDSAKSSLKSPLLSRLMMRCPKHEPRPTVASDGDMATKKVRVTKPHPRPPKCTETPFLLKNSSHE